MSLRKRMEHWLLLASGNASRSLALSCDVEIDLQAAEGDEEHIPTFHMLAYTGGPMNVGYRSPVVIDLKGVRATRGQVKILREHDRDRVLGHADEVKVEDDGIVVTGTFSGDDDEVHRVVEAARRGFKWEASVGAHVERFERVAEGEEVVLNGQTFTGPLLVARRTVLKEVSFVALGADEDTNTSVAAGEHDGDTDMDFDTWLGARGWDAQNLSKDQLATLRAAFDAEPDADDTARTGASMQASDDGIETRIRQEQARAREIQAICAQHGNPEITVSGRQVDLAAHAIRAGLSLADVQRECELHHLRASRPAAPEAVVRGGMEPQLMTSALEASLCRAARMDSQFIERQFPEQVLEAADHQDIRNASLHQLLHIVARANGDWTTPGRTDESTFQAAIRHDPMRGGGLSASLSGSGGYSTISLAGILGNLANKAMLEQFETMESVVPEICYETDTNDFKDFSRFRLGLDGDLSEVGPDGNLKSISLAESEFSNRLKTHGATISLTRRHIIDDDLGAFLEIPRTFATLAVQAREEVLIGLILSNPGNFFDASNGNYFDGATSALSFTSLAKASGMFRTMKDANGKPSFVRPGILFGPPAIEVKANELYVSSEVRDPQAKGGTANTLQGMFKPVISPYLSTVFGLPGSSDTAWYLLALPSSGRAVAQMAYLRGRRTPTVESANARFSIGGIEWACYWDFGAAMQDKQAAVKSKGAA